MATVVSQTITGKAFNVTVTLANDEYFIKITATKGATTKTATINFLE